MKKIVLLIVCALSIGMCKAQCNIYYYTPGNFDPVGCSTPDSLFFDQGAGTALDFRTDGVILGWGDPEATYNRTTGEFFDLNNHLMIKVEPDGDIRDPQDDLKGFIESGHLYDGNMDLIGSWSGDIDPYFIAYFYYYRILLF